MGARVVAGRYELVREIGRGSTGTVWLARDTRGGTDVALKLAMPEIAGQEGARSRFLREATVAATLEGPNVARVLDHGVTSEDELFLAMELLTGTSLEDELASQQLLTPGETCLIVSGVCRGLAIAHDARLVHRDIKPSNIFLQDMGDSARPLVKVLDFGSAKVADALSDAVIDPTRSGDLIGTPCYMSPEQALGSADIDLRADLWAVGVVAFECMTGSRPFEAPALGPLITKILTGRIPSPSSTAPDAGIPPSVDAWMARVLSRDPKARPRSATELAGTLVQAFESALTPGDADATARDESSIRDPWTAGDFSAATGAVIARYGPEILRFLYAKLENEDLASEAFSIFEEKVLLALPRFKWTCSARGWAYTIARNCAADERRREWRNRKQTAPLTDSRVAAIAQEVRSKTLPFLRTERRTALLKLRDDLPPDDKLLLVLRFERKLAWLDVARVMLGTEDVDDKDKGLVRESARLRKRYQFTRGRLRERARAEGLLVPELDDDDD